MRKWLKALMGRGSGTPRESSTPDFSALDELLHGKQIPSSRPIVDFMPALYEQVAAVKADAELKVLNAHYWRNVGDVVGAAYALLSFMLEALPVLPNQKRQAQLALEYLHSVRLSWHLSISTRHLKYFKNTSVTMMGMVMARRQ